MAEPVPTYEDLLRTGIYTFNKIFDEKMPTTMGYAPGRVNLIGEHTDYNAGFVFPMALPMVTIVIGALNHSTKINIYTDANVENCFVTFKTPGEVQLLPGEPFWANYIKGVVALFQGEVIPGFDAVIVSSLPLDAGLAGSAALTVSTYNFLESLTNTKTSVMTKANICRNVEHTYAGHPCGLMDQFIAIFGKKGHATMLDCLTLNCNQVPFADPRIAVLIINSNAVRRDAHASYVLRKHHCNLAVQALGVQWLRDVGIRDLIKHRKKMVDKAFHRAKHVVTENNRVIEASRALVLKDYDSLGLILLQSHNSLRDDYEVTCKELDELVEICMNTNGVLGSRMTGAGFGGCTISIVKKDFIDDIIDNVKKKYSGKATFYTACAAGAHAGLSMMFKNVRAELCSVEEACGGKSMAERIPVKSDLIKTAVLFYKKHFNNEFPTIAASAPGRVNIIGEHTDYNNGFVFPMALPLVTIVVGKGNNSDSCHIYSLAEGLHEPNSAIFKIPKVGKLTQGTPKWANYCKGVVANFKGTVPGFNAVIVSSVPVGGGVSSSAALEVALYTFLESLTSTSSDLKEKALACQKAEHEFANMPCGIMDQFAAIFCTERNFLLLDCGNMELKSVEYDDPNLVVLITNSNIKHKLSGSEYPTRKRQCQEAASVMKIQSLREADVDLLEENKNNMDPLVYRRARHVIGEIQRTLDGVQALSDRDYKAFGYLMLQSHYSLRYDYEVSCKELDELVDIAMKTKGVYGSRMTGGGFGGCTVTLVEATAVPDVISKIRENFKGKPLFYIATPSIGTTDETTLLKSITSKLT